MSMFPGSSYLSISGGTFTNINLPTSEAGRCSTRNSDGLMIVQTCEVVLHKELISGNRYRIHYASHGGRFVGVRTFEGPSAKQDLAVAMALSGEAFHPNVLKIVGVSDESSKNHFVLFHGITSEQKMQSLIAAALRTDLNTSVQLSMKAVKGIAAGLSYLKSQNILMHVGKLDFDVFIGYGNEPILSPHPSDTSHDDDPVSQNSYIETGDCGIGVLNRVCQQLFSGANTILYNDSPEREFDVYDKEDLPAATLEDAEGASNLSESETTLNPSSSTKKSKSTTTPRREVWWLDLGATNQCLESIKQCFENFLDRSLISSSNSLLRRIRSAKDNIFKRNMHQCSGYLREEITLTSDVSRSAIVSHVFPSQSELCSICGQLVQYAYSHSSITDEEIEWGEDRPLDFPVFDNEGRGGMDFAASLSVSPLSSAWNDTSEESDVSGATFTNVNLPTEPDTSRYSRRNSDGLMVGHLEPGVGLGPSLSFSVSPPSSPKVPGNAHIIGLSPDLQLPRVVVVNPTPQPTPPASPLLTASASPFTSTSSVASTSAATGNNHKDWSMLPPSYGILELVDSWSITIGEILR